MTDPRLRLALALSVGLLPGIAVGAVLTPAGGGGAAVGRLGGTEERAAHADTRAAARESSQESADRAPDRDAAATSDANATPRVSTPFPPPGTTDVASDALRAELRALLASGRIEQALAQNPDALLPMLVRLHCQLGDAQSALDLLLANEHADASHFDQLAQLAASSDPAVAGVALTKALEMQLGSALEGGRAITFDYPFDSYVQRAASIDPQLALELLGRLRAQGLEERPDIAWLEARALARVGNLGRARDLLMAQLDDQGTRSGALSTLIEIDPVAGEAEMVRLLGQREDVWIRGELLGLLARQGRTSEAVEMFEAALAAGRADGLLWQKMLGGLPSATLDAELGNWIANGDLGFDVYNALANYYHSNGDLHAYLDAQKESWEKCLETGAWLPMISMDAISAYPGEVVAILDDAAQKIPENDEMWGDLADQYWQAGEHDLAIAAWEHANQLDPNDSEWTGKLDAAATGGTPVWTGSDVDDGLGDVSDLYPSQPDVPIFDGWNGGWGYSGGQFSWEGGEIIYDEMGGLPMLDHLLEFDGQLQALGYVVEEE
ncbi:MAG: hypothetical protein R3F34_10085 [Planctomycetota bacterium]